MIKRVVFAEWKKYGKSTGPIRIKNIKTGGQNPPVIRI